MGFVFTSRLPMPAETRERSPLAPELIEIKHARNEEIERASTGRDDEFVVITDPCSADNEESACDYAGHPVKTQEKTRDKLVIISRVYTNKPRTTDEGYMGTIHQPDPEKRPDVFEGILAIRHIHMRVLWETDFPTAGEVLYPENMNYLSGMMSYVAVGARSVEDQFHRLVASGCDIPVGMKNSASGSLAVMLNSVMATQLPHDSIFHGFEAQRPGSPLTHTIPRGVVNKRGQYNPNYHYEDLKFLFDPYNKHGLQNPACIVDTNRANSNKQYHEQTHTAKETLRSRCHSGDIKNLIKGLMIESYIEPGSQKIGGYCYDKSITDPCLEWDDTERLLYGIVDNLGQDHTITRTRYEPGKEPAICFTWQALFHSVNHSLYL